MSLNGVLNERYIYSGDMDSSSPTNSYSHLVYRSSSSLKKVAPQDESDEPINQQVPAEAGTIVLMQVPQKIIPTPPALPPPGFSRKMQGSASRNGVQNFQSSGGSLLVPKEMTEMWDQLFLKASSADVTILTEDGGSFQAHSIVLISASPVLKTLIKKQQARKTACKIMVVGVPLAAARMFVRMLYSSRYEHADMEKYVLHLVVLSHVYGVHFVKKLCTHQLEQGLLTVENVIDVLQLARLCDVPRLNLMSLRLIINDFKNVARTEGWRVMRESDPSLEQELVEAVIDADSRRQGKIRKIEEEKVYGQLRDAMEALVHICRDGCRTIGPYDKPFDGRQPGPCQFPACKGIESLVRHFAGCRVKVPGGCVHCKRMWQLLELHSRMCQDTEICRVPLCRHFKEKLGHQSKKDENKWKLLVSRVMAAKHSANAFSLATVSARLEEE